MASSSKIVQNKLITSNLLHVVIEKPGDFKFTAGQFVRFYIPNGDKKIYRSYSIASTPNDNALHFFIRLYENGAGSEYILKLPEYATLEWDGPYGIFVNKTNKPLFLVATGAGLAPCFSILKNELIEKHNAGEIRLLLGLRHEEDRYVVEELESLQNKFPNFLYRIILSKPAASWTGSRGHVTDYLPADVNQFEFFLCGNPEMIKEVRAILIHRKLPKNQIHQEIF